MSRTYKKLEVADGHHRNADGLPVCVVMPAWNAAPGISSALAEVIGTVFAVVVVDGGSTDSTVSIAEALGARVVEAPRGRGSQLARGAEAAMRIAEGPWLLFLHADTVLQPGWREAVTRHTASPAGERKAAAFRLALGDPSPAARRLERLVAWRCRTLALPYGDQGLLIHRDLYQKVGGFRPIPLMEDVDIVRRLGRRRLVMLDASAKTSEERYRRDGYWQRSTRNLTLLSLYFLGVSPERLARWYG